MSLRRINWVMLGVIIAINLYIIAAPFVPRAVYWAEKHHSGKVYTLTQALQPTAALPQDNRLVVPSMLLSQPVFEGKSMNTLLKGAWRVPYTSTPDKGGNTVIIGHRFTYTNPTGTFYNLDKVQVGDEIGLFWDNKRYLYKVNQTKVVPPTAKEVEAPTVQPTLTLYSCTPLWNPKNRLVVVASLEHHS